MYLILCGIDILHCLFLVGVLRTDDDSDDSDEDGSDDDDSAGSADSDEEGGAKEGDEKEGEGKESELGWCHSPSDIDFIMRSPFFKNETSHQASERNPHPAVVRTERRSAQRRLIK